MSKKHPDWSYKEDGPAKRYMMFRDLAGKVRYLNGYYSPKTDDNGWCQSHREELEQTFADANIVGDGHFSWARDNLTQAHFYAPVNANEAVTKQAKKNNLELRKVRGPIEGIFGWMKSNFQQMAQSWQEGEEQQRFMVFLLAAVYTYQVD